MIGLISSGGHSNRFPMNPTDAYILQADALRTSKKLNFYLFLIIVVETILLFHK
jgi:hypothetical protein